MISSILISTSQPPIRNYLTSLSGVQSQYVPRRTLLSSDVAVQTENTVVIPTAVSNGFHRVEEDQESTLSASDLASILKWSKEISRDINLSSGMIIPMS